MEVPETVKYEPTYTDCNKIKVSTLLKALVLTWTLRHISFYIQVMEFSSVLDREVCHHFE